MAFALIFTFLVMVSALAHQSSTTATGSEITWLNKSVPLVIDPRNDQSDPAVVKSIILQSVAEWNRSSSAQIVPANSGLNHIRFTKDFAIFGSAVLGVTEVTFNSAGVIQQASILINDNHFHKTTAGFNFLGDVITHELGHLMGLAHSEVINSSMFYANYPGQSTVAFDDQAGIRSKYDSSFGTISGVIRGGQQIPVMGAHVQAISLKRGEMASTISLQDGSFRISGLDLNDSYYLYVSPLKKLDALAPYLANVQNNFCPADYVGSFFNACGKANEGKPQPLTLTQARPRLDVGTVTINCSLKTSPDYTYEKVRNPMGSISIYDFEEAPRTERAFVGYFKKPTDDDWLGPDKLEIDLRGLTQNLGARYLKVQLIAQPLGSRLEFDLRLQRAGANGDPAPWIRRWTEEGTIILDREEMLALSTNPEQNDFFVEVRARALDLPSAFLSFPAFQLFSQQNYLPYLLIASIWQDSAEGRVPVLNTTTRVSDNATCLDAPFTYSVSKASPSSSESRSAQADQGVPVTCGSIGSPPQGPGGSGAVLMALGFMLSLLTSLGLKKTKKFLS
jgi:hypothetical protein